MNRSSAFNAKEYGPSIRERIRSGDLWPTDAIRQYPDASMGTKRKWHRAHIARQKAAK